MPTITGNVRTFFKQDMSDRSVMLRILPSGLQIIDNNVFSSAPKEVFPEAGSGLFTVNLEESKQGGYYTIQVWWLDSAGGMSLADFPEVKIFVPAEGGEIGDLADVPLEFGEVWVSPGGVEPPGSKPGDLLFDPNNSLLYVIN